MGELSGPILDGTVSHFDIGALDLGPPDTQAPMVTFLQPPVLDVYARGCVALVGAGTFSGGVWRAS